MSVCTVALAVPASANAAPASFGGPATADEGAGKATYAFDCGDSALPGVGDSGALAVTVTDGPGAGAGVSDRGIPSPAALACSPLTRSFTIELPIIDDAEDEPDEAYTVTVTGTLTAGGAVSKSVSTVIVDNDAAPAPATEVADSGTSEQGSLPSLPATDGAQAEAGGTPEVTSSTGPLVTIRRPKLTRRALIVPLVCPATADGCSGRVVATSRKLRMGRRSFTLARGATSRVKVRLSRRARAAVRRRSLRVTLRATAVDAAGAQGTMRRTFRLPRVR